MGGGGVQVRTAAAWGGQPACRDLRTDPNDAAVVTDSSLLSLFSSLLFFEGASSSPSSSSRPPQGPGGAASIFSSLLTTDFNFNVFFPIVLLHSNRINIVCDSRRVQMLNYSGECDWFRIAAASAGSRNVAATHRAGERGKLETVAGIQQQQTGSSSSFDCRRQMKSDTFREKNPGRSRVCRAPRRRRLAATRPR